MHHFVYTSYSGNIRRDSPLETAKRDFEQRLLSSRMRVTLLRLSYFMEMWLSPALGFDPANSRARIYGSGEAKVSYISLHDVVAFALAVAANPSHPSAILEMGGSEGLSQLEAVGIFERTLRKKVEVDRLPPAALEDQHRSSDLRQKTFAALMIGYA